MLVATPLVVLFPPLNPNRRTTTQSNKNEIAEPAIKTRLYFYKLLSFYAAMVRLTTNCLSLPQQLSERGIE